jgi:hypothetical protein
MGWERELDAERDALLLKGLDEQPDDDGEVLTLVVR